MNCRRCYLSGDHELWGRFTEFGHRMGVFREIPHRPEYGYSSVMNSTCCRAVTKHRIVVLRRRTEVTLTNTIGTPMTNSVSPSVPGKAPRRQRCRYRPPASPVVVGAWWMEGIDLCVGVRLASKWTGFKSVLLG